MIEDGFRQGILRLNFKICQLQNPALLDLSVVQFIEIMVQVSVK